MKMTIGKFKGQPVEQMTTPYLAWLVTRDNIRFKYWSLVKEALRILRHRLNDFDATIAELEVKEAPPEYWKTPERDERRKREQAEKLRRLEEQRHQERLQYRLQRQLQRQASQHQQALAGGQVVDGARYLREARLAALQAEQARRQQAAANDVSDLV